MLGMFAIFRGPENDFCDAVGVPKTMDLELAYSRNLPYRTARREEFSLLNPAIAQPTGNMLRPADFPVHHATNSSL